MNKDIFVQLLGQRQFKAVRSILDVMNEVDIASLLSELDDKELALAFRLIPKDKAAEVFARYGNFHADLPCRHVFRKRTKGTP